MKVDIYPHILPVKYKEALYQIASSPRLKEAMEASPGLFDLDVRFRILDKYDCVQVLTLDIPHGSRLNAEPSQSVAFATVGVAFTFSDAFTVALSRAFYAAGKPEETQAGGPGSVNHLLLSGINEQGRHVGGLFLSLGHSFGCGAQIEVELSPPA